MLDEKQIKNAILLFLWLDYLVNQYISLRQLKKTLETTDVPEEIKSLMSAKAFVKLRKYILLKLRFGFIKNFFEIIISTIVIELEILPIVWEYSASLYNFKNELLTSCIWYLVFSTSLAIVNLPFILYDRIIIRQKFWLKKHSNSIIIGNKLRKFVLSQIFFTLIAASMVIIIQHYGIFIYIYFWLGFSSLIFIVYLMHPAVIAPSIHTSFPLGQSELRTQIENLASQIEFPLMQIHVTESSSKPPHSYIFFGGLFKTKQIFLYSSLFSKQNYLRCGDEEIIGLLAHELGHWYHNHRIKYAIVVELNLLLLFVGFVYCLQYAEIYKAFGFYSKQPLMVGMYIVLKYVMVFYNNCLGFILTYFSRKCEFQADLFAVNLGKSKSLINAMFRINKDNFTFPVCDKFYSAWHYEYPSLLERITYIKLVCPNKNE